MQSFEEAAVSRETQGRLEHFAELVRKWSPRINLVSSGDLPLLWDRHIADSLQVATCAPADVQHWADLGSGGGFPIVVVAIVLSERRPDCRFTCVESDIRKATFLRTVRRELMLPLDVLPERAEDAAPLKADVVSARALAPLEKLLPLIHRHLAPSGLSILPKGRGAIAELEAAAADWVFDCDSVPSLTAPDARILLIRNLRHA